MGTDQKAFEFRATLGDLEEGLDVMHESVDRLREAIGRPVGDKPLILFETAVAEIGSNALVHGRAGTERPVDYVLRWYAGTAVAWVIDGGPPVDHNWAREMPPATSEAGRGLALARSLLDELEYERVGQLNRWRLMKRL